MFQVSNPYFPSCVRISMYLCKMSLTAVDLAGISNEVEFEKAALQTFQMQYNRLPFYRNFVDLLGIKPQEVQQLTAIPFLPIRFFKSQQILAEGLHPLLHFESSGTTGMLSSKHFLADTNIYNTLSVRNFESVYGPLKEYCILALLPSYLERGQSSLVFMVQHFMNVSGHPDAGFYLNNLSELANTIKRLERTKQKVLLIGVTYALLDFAEQFPSPLENTIIMETGGMKGRRKEMLREEVHHILKSAFLLHAIHSEYGMTELLSQAYAPADGVFNTPTWMRVLLRDPNDPLCVFRHGVGAVNIIDLANQDSCAFIATDDLANVDESSSFKILGRLDDAELRGCNLLVQ